MVGGRQTPIGEIESGEIEEVQVYILTGFNNFDKVAGQDVVIELISGNKIIDTANLILSKRAWG